MNSSWRVFTAFHLLKWLRFALHRWNGAKNSSSVQFTVLNWTFIDCFTQKTITLRVYLKFSNGFTKMDRISYCFYCRKHFALYATFFIFVFFAHWKKIRWRWQSIECSSNRWKYQCYSVLNLHLFVDFFLLCPSMLFALYTYIWKITIFAQRQPEFCWQALVEYKIVKKWNKIVELFWWVHCHDSWTCIVYDSIVVFLHKKKQNIAPPISRQFHYLKTKLLRAFVIPTLFVAIFIKK